MTDRAKGPINGVDSAMVEHMVCGQIEQRYDALRMRQFWKRLIAGDNDPDQVADGICRALSGGHYVRKEPAVVSNISVQVFGEASPEGLAQALSGALGPSLKSAHTG
ncbi:hypothetical protein GPJ81_14030 [Pseudomonas alkylphenolica]|uniref:Uncharacterized protein n=1 Tax=Pseudomonas alkylphenolica TaxID=237609 RepID=A0A6I6HHM1_9PSED|nr:hypothetical protein [Pseudomonas alkylphenolica]QGW77757.1 hypothetical protein GPJ81_14030 [Pseudomonas alkylphenolica]